MQDAETLWKENLTDIEKNVSRTNFVTLFKNTSLLSLNDTVATVTAPSTMIIDLLEKRFADEIKTALDKHTGKNMSILYTVKTIAIPEKAVAGPLFNESAPQKQSPIGHLPRVRPDYTFENFAVSGSNQLAYTAATRVANNIGTSYNPLFLYGPVGVGKTHLMHAIANYAYSQHPEKKVIYITSEEFTNDVIEAIRTNDTASMKRRFRSAYLLLIDDIQFIEGKERVQEELFHTFNILIDSGSQIALSSDRPPHEIKRLEKRLSSRFAGGLTVDIDKPDIELKTSILQIKAEKYGHILPTDVALFLANQAEDTRTLEGLLLRMITQATAGGMELTMDLAHRIIGVSTEERREHLHADDIVKSVCTFYNIKPTQLKGPKRDAGLVKARQICMYLLKTELDITLVEIGNLLGGRDHTTVMHGVEKIETLVENKAKIAEDIRGIIHTLRG